MTWALSFTDPACDPRPQHIVVDSIEELLQIKIYHPALTCTDVRLRSAHRLMSVATRTETKTPLREGRLKKRLQHLLQRLLDEPVQPRRYTQCAYPARGLRDIHSSHGWGRYRPASSASFTLGQCTLSQSLNSDTVMSSTPGAPLFWTTR